MKQLKIKDHLSNNELKQRIRKEKNAQQLKVWQCLYYIKNNKGVSASTVANIFVLSVHTVYKYVQNYNRNGVDAVILKHRGGRRRFFLTLEKEKELLNSLSNKAAKGLILTMNDIRIEVESNVGRTVSDDYIWDLFSRHNWKKKAPRPKHPDQDIEKQNDFKKNSKKMWQPLS